MAVGLAVFVLVGGEGCQDFGLLALWDLRNYSIDARGAQAGVADQIVAAIKAYDASLDRTLPRRMSDMQMRLG
jgi:hypothetical protein